MTQKVLDYYRTRYDYFTGDVRLKLIQSPIVQLTAGITSQFYTSSAKNNTDKFLRDFDIGNPDKKIFDNRMYAGLVAGLEVNTRNDAMLPTRGMYLNAEIMQMNKLDGSKPGLATLRQTLIFTCHF